MDSIIQTGKKTFLKKFLGISFHPVSLSTKKLQNSSDKSSEIFGPDFRRKLTKETFSQTFSLNVFLKIKNWFWKGKLIIFCLNNKFCSILEFSSSWKFFRIYSCGQLWLNLRLLKETTFGKSSKKLLNIYLF